MLDFIILCKGLFGCGFDEGPKNVFNIQKVCLKKKKKGTNLVKKIESPLKGLKCLKMTKMYTLLTKA